MEWFRGGSSEQTINCDTAVHRWVLTSHERAAVTQICSDMAEYSGADVFEGVVKEKSKARLSRDEEDVRKVQSIFTTWINPFAPSESDEICQIASGVMANKNLEQDLSTAYDKVKEVLVTYIQKRLSSNEACFCMMPYPS